jgi:hypothetical protein
LAGVAAAQGSVLPGDHDHAGGRGTALDRGRPTGVAAGPTGRTPREPGRLGRGERVRAGAQ